MKISAILKNNLKFYKNNSFMCALVTGYNGISYGESMKAKEFIQGLLGGYGTLHAKLKKEIPSYTPFGSLGELENAYSFFVSDRAYQMRVLWWESVIAQLEEQGK